MKDYKSKLILAASILILMAILLKSGSVILFSIFICTLIMFHKRYIGVVLGIDVCMVFTLLAASSYGPSTGSLVGGLSYFLGMMISFEFGKSPMVTFYGTAFYAVLGFLFSVFPLSLLYNYPLVIICVVNVLFSIGAFFLGAPPAFLTKYVFTNTITNMLFIRTFGDLLKSFY